VASHQTRIYSTIGTHPESGDCIYKQKQTESCNTSRATQFAVVNTQRLSNEMVNSPFCYSRAPHPASRPPILGITDVTLISLFLFCFPLCLCASVVNVFEFVIQELEIITHSSTGSGHCWYDKLSGAWGIEGGDSRIYCCGTQSVRAFALAP